MWKFYDGEHKVSKTIGENSQGICCGRDTPPVNLVQIPRIRTDSVIFRAGAMTGR
jgi:hypothetical protein